MKNKYSYTYNFSPIHYTYRKMFIDNEDNNYYFIVI